MNIPNADAAMTGDADTEHGRTQGRFSAKNASPDSESSLFAALDISDPSGSEPGDSFDPQIEREGEQAGVGDNNDGREDETSEDAPFFIARKLLRRRHVRKEQLRKEREAMTAQAMGGSKRKINLHVDTAPLDGRRIRTKYPRLSPIQMFELAKNGSFVVIGENSSGGSTFVSPEKSLGNEGSSAMPIVESSCAPFGVPCVPSRLVLPTTMSSSFSFSPVRSRRPVQASRSFENGNLGS